MNIKDIMVNPAVHLLRQSNLKEIIKAFQKIGLDALPVLDEEQKVAGIINFDDIAKMFEPYYGPLDKLVRSLPFLDIVAERDFSINEVNPELISLCLAEDIMSANFVALTEDMNLEKAYSVMRSYKVETITVVRNGYYIGLVRFLDIIVNLFREKGIID